LIVFSASLHHSGAASTAASKSGRAISRALFSSFTLTQPLKLTLKHKINGRVHLIILSRPSLVRGLNCHHAPDGFERRGNARDGGDGG